MFFFYICHLINNIYVFNVEIVVELLENSIG